MSKKRTYTDDEKTEALALYATDGPTAVEQVLGIPKGTVTNWAKALGIETVRYERAAARVDASKLDRQALREELRTMFLAKAVDLLHRMDEPHIDFRGKDAVTVTFPKADAASCRAYATAAAICLDKFRLEMGEATDRTEHHDPRRRVAQVRDELAARRDRREASAA